MEDNDALFQNASVEEIYRYLGNSIVRSIKADWETASIYVEITAEDVTELYGRYKTASISDESEGFFPESEVYDAFDELRRRMQRPNKVAWSHARFALNRNGTFDLAFGYGSWPENSKPKDV